LQAFDAGRSAPALSNLLSSGGLAAAGKRVLVPGCGRGYDVIEFVGKGASLAVGLELAPTAQQAASQHLAEQLGKEGQGQQWDVFSGDFFRWEHPSSNSFDVGYDYTFMWCAYMYSLRVYVQPGYACSSIRSLPLRLMGGWLIWARLDAWVDALTLDPVPTGLPSIAALQCSASRHAAGLGGGLGALPAARSQAGLPGLPNRPRAADRASLARGYRDVQASAVAAW
jgi:SAM-dependent methyltransferase